ncbi:FMN-binding protein [Salinibacterium sp. NK8237]|uniref:FMN-binding protein n=1 Tax=Salinibacterium sp. NK8237 TaxID=2792038 RepID=UPI0027DC7F6D|nr:FMN-binding protein [Salinibacterium sp. NK8237]
MRTRAVLGSILASLSVLVLGYQAGATVIAGDATSLVLSTDTGAETDASESDAADDTVPNVTDDDAAADETATDEVPSEDAEPTGPADGTYSGATVTTRYGDVQVAVTISAGTIADVATLQLTATGRSAQISNEAIPILRAAVIESQTADVANVSGATYTADAYLASLQSALDAAGA